MQDVIPEILKQEAVLKYRKLLRQLSGDLRPASHEGEGDVVVNEGNDWNLVSTWIHFSSINIDC